MVILFYKIAKGVVMSSLELSFNAVMPIFILMLIGYVLKISNFAEKIFFDGINKLVFRLFLPVLLFYNIYSTESLNIFDGKLIIFTIAGVFFVFAVGFFAVRLITHHNSRRGVLLQSFFRTNYAILGIPLVENICKGNTTGLASVMVAVIVPVFNILAVIGLEYYRNGTPDFKKVVRSIITNPLIVGCIAGTVLLFLNIKLPSMVEKSVYDIGKVATPLSIIALGASFSFTHTKDCAKELVIATVARLVVIPLLVICTAVTLGFRGEPLACVLIASGAPVAVSSFAMSQQMGGDENLAAQVIVVTSALCLFSLFGWIFALSSLGLF